MQFKQVLDNVARFAANHETLPSFAYPGSGTSQVSDQGNASVNLTWDPRSIISEALGISGNRTNTETWGLVPINDPDRLLAMRCAYQRLFAYESEDCDKKLAMFLTDYQNRKDLLIPMCWFCTGKKRDVPCNACYVSQYCDTYVWVMPEGIDGFTRFSMTILDIATAHPASSKVCGSAPTSSAPSMQRDIFVPSPQPNILPATSTLVPEERGEKRG